MDLNNSPLTDAVWNDWLVTLKTRYAIDLHLDVLPKFKRYLLELKKWNENINLISYRSEHEILWRHFTDSLMSIKLIEKYRKNQTTDKANIVDLGTGAGFPGFIIKIAKPEYDITLVESQKKKCDFLEHLKNTLDYPGLKIINDRAENLGQNFHYREQYDFAVSRAMCKLPPNLEVSIPLIKVGGRVIIYKTEEFADELKNDEHTKNVLGLLNSELVEIFKYNICELEQNFSIIVLEKKLKTPERYPRRPGIPEKKPL